MRLCIIVDFILICIYIFIFLYEVFGLNLMEYVNIYSVLVICNLYDYVIKS